MDTPTSSGIADYLAALKRRRSLMALLAMPVLALALAIAIGLPNVYRSTALFKFGKADVSGELQSQDNESFRTDQFVDQYVTSLQENVLGRDNLRGILSKVRVRPDQEAHPDAALSDVATNTTIQTVRAQVLDPSSGRERDVVSAVTLSFDSPDPKVSHEVAVWLGNSFLAASRSLMQQRARAAAQFYSTEAERFRANIVDLESKLADFKSKNYGRLPELTGMNMNALDRTERDLDNMQNQIQTLNRERIFLVQQLEQARAVSPDAGMLKELEAELAQKSAVYDENHPDIIALRRKIDSLRSGGPAAANMSLPEQLAAQRGTLAKARLRYSDDHPDVRRIIRNIESLEARIARGERGDNEMLSSPVASQLRTQIQATDNQIAGLQMRSAELRQKLGEFENRVEATPMVEREYQKLTRDLDLARKKYDELLGNQMEAELKEAAIASGRSDELKLVQPPGQPSAPAKPARVSIVIIGLIFAIALGVMGAIVAEIMDQTVRGSRDIRRLLSVTPLAVVPGIPEAGARQRLIARAIAFSASLAAGTILLVIILRIVA